MLATTCIASALGTFLMACLANYPIAVAPALLSFSITDGIAFGFISYVVLSVLSGRARKLHWLMILFTACLTRGQ